MKQLHPTPDSGTAEAEAPASPTPGTENWQASWMAAAQKETPARRYLMEEALRRFQQRFPEESGE